MATSRAYLQELIPSSDIVTEWKSSAATHWTEIDDDPDAPTTGSYINAPGLSYRNKVDRFGLTNPNKNNLEGGFDQIRVGFFAWHPSGQPNIEVYVRVYVKGAWTGYLTKTVTGEGADEGAIYSGTWYEFCCDQNDADDIQVEVKSSSSTEAGNSVIIAALRVYIQASDILTAATARKLAHFI